MNILDFVPVVGKLIDRIIPDKNERERLKHEVQVLSDKGELQLLLGQLEINKQEAKSPFLFVAGWRPAIGWTCVAGLVWHFVFSPIVFLMLAVAGLEVVMPELNILTLITLVGTMLGMSTIRMNEKINKVARRG